MEVVVYRIAKTLQRCRDLSGTGAFRNGGRWNSRGTYMLYTSINSSLAYLENLVHFNDSDIPPGLFIAAIEISAEDNLVYQLPEDEYPALWLETGNIENKLLGDQLINEAKFLAIKVRSAINPSEFNFLLNPLFPGFHDKVIIRSLQELNIDPRLLKRPNS